MATAYPVYNHPTAPGLAQFLDADTMKIGSIEAAGTLKLAPLTLGSVPFIGASGLVSQDNANFFWDNTNFRLGLGTATPNRPLSVEGTLTANSAVGVANLSTTGYSAIGFQDSSRVDKGSIGWGNASVGLTALQNKLYLYQESGVDFLHYCASGGTVIIKSDGKVGVGCVDPAAVFEVLNSTATYPVLKLSNTYSNGTYATIAFHNEADAFIGEIGAANSNVSLAPVRNAFYFQTGDTRKIAFIQGTTTPFYAFYVVGNQGCIGTTSPSGTAVLTVNGTIVGTQATATTEAVMAGRTISAGTGLSGGGDLTTNRTLSLDQAVIPTWTGAHTFTGGVTFKNHSAFAGSGFIPETRAVQTTTVTPAVLWSKTLADDTLYWVEVRVIGRDISGAERAYYGRTFYAYRQSAGSATLGNVIELFSEETDADWDVGVNVNTNDVEVKVTGKGSVTINWAGTVTMQAVSGNA